VIRDGNPVEIPYQFDPAFMHFSNLETFRQGFPKLERAINFLLANLGLGGNARIYLLGKLAKLRKILARPPWLVFEETRAWVTQIVANICIAIDGAISHTAAVRDESILNLQNKLAGDVSLQDVTKTSLDVEPQDALKKPPPALNEDNNKQYAKW